MKRREILRNAGLVGGGLLATQAFAAAKETSKTAEKKEPALERVPTAIVIGAGNRGHDCYASWILKNPQRMKVVGVAEPREGRRERMLREHAIKNEHTFTSWEQVFELPKFADAVIIATPDSLHYGPAMAALKAGYDVLLEKPVGMDWKECNDILQLQRKTGKMVAVCHVLRYSSYFIKMKELLDNGVIGEILDVQHMEPVGHIHYSHSYVRGNWGNKKTSAPFLLAKSCHDLDIIKWIVERPCRKVTSFGSRGEFVPERAPKGSADRCFDCKLADSCRYSAKRIYITRKEWSSHHLLDGAKTTPENIAEALRTGPYGRCVWKCDNNQLDRQIVNMEFEGGLPVSFHLCIGDFGGRQTRINGTLGSMRGDMKSLEVRTMESRKWVKHDIGWIDGHGGGDAGLISSFAEAISKQDLSYLATTLDESMESHLIGYRAEDSVAQDGLPMNVIPLGKEII